LFLFQFSGAFSTAALSPLRRTHSLAFLEKDSPSCLCFIAFDVKMCFAILHVFGFFHVLSFGFALVFCSDCVIAVLNRHFRNMSSNLLDKLNENHFIGLTMAPGGVLFVDSSLLLNNSLFIKF
jgi:hypothetical protein